MGWPLVALVVLWYCVDRFMRFPGWGLALQFVVALILAAVVYHVTSGSRLRRASKGVVFGPLVVSWTEFFLGVPFIFFVVLVLGLALWWPIGGSLSAGRSTIATVGIRVGLLVVALALPFAVGQYMVWMNESLSSTGTILEGLEPAPPPYPPTMGDEWQAVKDYEPFWLFSAHERWLPSRAEDYVADPRALLKVDGKPHPATAVTDPGAKPADSCRTASAARCRLTIQCKDEHDSCAKDGHGASVVYAHVVDDPLGADGFPRDDSLVGRTRRVIEYWAFYRYDAWTGWGGLFHQWHESDWEAVTVGLGEHEPLWVGFSSHCGGSWRRWGHGLGAMDGRRGADDRLVPLPRHPPGHHPLAFVADGTHATYPDDFPRQPDWDSCAKKLPLVWHVATFGPTYGAGVRETLDQVDAPDDFYGPKLIMATDTSPLVMAFHGTWAVEDHQHMITDDIEGGGPPSPPLQRIWSHPLSQIFCGDYWYPKTACPTR